MTAYQPEHDVRGGGGLYWLVAALILGFVGAVFNAWILLVEIHR
jgi:hypothetical protein